MLCVCINSQGKWEKKDKQRGWCHAISTLIFNHLRDSLRDISSQRETMEFLRFCACGPKIRWFFFLVLFIFRRLYVWTDLGLWYACHWGAWFCIIIVITYYHVSMIIWFDYLMIWSNMYLNTCFLYWAISLLFINTASQHWGQCLSWRKHMINMY